MAVVITDIMDGLETALGAITGLRVASEIPNQINPPQAVVGVPDIPEYHQTGQSGFFELEPTITVLTSATIDRVGQRQLAGYANPTGSTSVKAAIESDRTLGAKVEDCIVVGFRVLRSEEVNTIGYYGGIFTLKVAVKGS